MCSASGLMMAVHRTAGRRDSITDYFLPLVGLTVDDGEQLDRTFAGYLTHHEAAWRKFDDVDGALERIRRADVRTAVLTNGTVEQQNVKIAAVGLTDRVGPIFTAEELGAAKPDPSTYLTVCRRLGVPADSDLHVGDATTSTWSLLGPRAYMQFTLIAATAGRTTRSTGSPRWRSCPTISPHWPSVPPSTD